MSRWVLQEWESSRSDLPYYRWETEAGKLGAMPPRVDTLDPGIYFLRSEGPLGRGSAEELVYRGYASLPFVIGLENRYTGNRYLLDSSNSDGLVAIDRIEDSLPCPEGVGGIIHRSNLGMMAHSLYDRIGFQNNRLFATLPSSQAAQLMEDWIEACFIGERCLRVGVFYDRADDRADPKQPGSIPYPAGFVALYRVDEQTEAIDLIGVARGYRGRGIGKALTQWAIQTCEAPTLQVRTECWNGASLRMYQCCGFRRVRFDMQFYARVEGR